MLKRLSLSLGFTLSLVVAMLGAAQVYPEALRLLMREGVLTGYPDASFRPEQGVTRAEAVSVTMRLHGVEVGAAPCFIDVPATAWYADSVCAAKESGLITGFADGSFRPERVVSYAEALKLLLGDESVTGSADTPWYAPYLSYATGLGLAPVLNAAEPLTRGDLVSLLYTLRQTEALRRGQALPSSGCGRVAEPLRSVSVRGASRELITVLPDPYDAQTPHNLVFGFHGRTSPNTQVRRYYRLEAHTNDTIFVYPEATRQGNGFTWSTPLEAGGVGPDVGLFDSVLDALAQGYCIDLARIYVVGHSLGAYYANDLACLRGDRLRAVASLGGGLTTTDCRSKTAAMILHNPKDRLVPVAEGERARDLFLALTNLSAASPLKSETLNCERYQVQSYPLALYPVVWCPHGVDYGYSGEYYPHTWPPEAGRVIMTFFESLEGYLTVAR